MRGRLILLCGLCAVLILFTGCPDRCWEDEDVKKMGQITPHLPVWTGTWKNCAWFTGFSEWQDWQADEYTGLREFVQNCDTDRSNFNGKFRVIDQGQFLGIQFSDKKTPLKFFLWLGEYKETPDLVVPSYDLDCSTFVLTGVLKYLPLSNEPQGPSRNTNDPYGYYEFGCQKENVRTYREKNDNRNGIYYYAYSLEADDLILFKLPVRTYQEKSLPENTGPYWLPQKFYKNRYLFYYFNAVYTDNTFSTVKFSSLCGDSKENALYYMGGVEQDGPVDNINKKVRYRLYDGTPD
ncbi:MAG: hypothetical protein M0P01_15180, partial [Treponema sp.]|nr:hypothetical protein [Treponema sp.]